ncbi:MAG TPA: hypothetical protein VLT82_23040 [Myxococcaceae bacterium]|nr:hypothetical protein [Myxococcaceae bacterium]
MKRLLFLTGFAGALVGCGNGLPTPPPLPTFSYGTPTSNLSAEQSNAANIGESGVGRASGTNGQSADPTAAPALADALAGNLPNSGLLTAPSPEAALKSLPVPSSEAAARAVRGAGLSVGDSSCVTHSGSSYSYSNCSYSGDGFSWTLNGSISASTSSISWDIKATFTASSQGVSGSGEFHWTGQLAWTATTVTGNGLSQLALKADGNGEHVEIAATSGWNADLQVDSTNHCISGGSLVVARAVEGSASNGQHVSSKAGWKFTWSGCNNVQVATGT